MKKEVKILSLLLIFTVSLTFILSGCNPDNTENTSVYTSVFSKIDTTVIPESSSAETTEESTVTEEPVSSEEPTVSVAPPAVSSAPVVSVPQTPTTITIAPEFTVYDPDNIRGLSEKSTGYGHGQQVSIDNQTRFNNMSGVEALAIDNISGQNRVFLTFDCGYEYNNLTASILDTLKEKNVKAVFFCTLPYLKQNPQLVWRMINEGHIVGNHSNTHPVFPTISRTKMANELYAVHKYLQENFGYTPKYFRFPTGAYSHSSLELVTSVGYKSIFWSFAYKDWETANQPDHAYALEKIKGAFYPGSVLLLHAVSATNTAILPQIIDYGISQGYTFATLDDYYAS